MVFSVEICKGNAMNLASLDLNLLRVFDAVYTHRNVSAPQRG